MSGMLRRDGKRFADTSHYRLFFLNILLDKALLKSVSIDIHYFCFKQILNC